ncbi:MAG: hypothetical protein WAU49_05925 [Steroidobacteraceae bacterium]
MSELAISIAANVALGLVLLALLFWQRAAPGVRLRDASEAIHLFRELLPEAEGTATLASDGRTALIELVHGYGIGVLQLQGKRWVARLLVPQDLASVRPTSDGALLVRLADFAWPRILVRFADESSCSQWMQRLQALRAASSPSTRAELRHA